MKVKELIELLSKQNQELDVVFGEDDWADIDTVKEDDNNGIQHPVVVIN
ncbi:hypothetical protein ABEY43_06045 [Priestia megaterium]|nr:hypothetical protein [Priestia flexa]